MNGWLAARRLARLVVHLVHGLWVGHVRLRGAPEAARLDRVQWWSAALLGHLGVELRAVGGLEPGAVLLASNHVSWLDIAALHAADPRIRFVSKAAVGHWPLIGGLARVAGTLFIERERKRDAMRVVHEVAAALGRGDAIGVFPEGTTGPGDSVLPFHANLLQAAIATEVPVQPVVIRYSQPGRPVSAAARYIGDTTLVGSLLRLAGAREVAVQVRFLDPVPTAGRQRRELCAALQHELSARLEADIARARVASHSSS